MNAIRSLTNVLLMWLGLAAVSSAAPISAIYVLGDSLSDQGNMKRATEIIGSPAPVLPDPLHYFEGRFSNGPVYVDYLASALGLASQPSIVGGSNFAYGGARTGYNTVEVQAGGGFPNGLFPWSLNAEVQAFRSRGYDDPNGLYIVFSGSNDVADILRRGLNPALAIPQVVAGIVAAVDAVQDANAQRVLVANVPDLGLTPVFSTLSPAVAAAATAVSADYNAALHAALQAISGIEILEFDTFGYLQNLVADPGRLGITDARNACYNGFVTPNANPVECSNADEFLFWDIIHPTTQVHAEIAARMLALIPEPSTLALLLPLLVVIRVARSVRS